MAVLPTGIGPVTGGYQIERSLRFNSADSAYLNRTPASATNRKTWTWSGWVKRGSLGSYQNFMRAGSTLIRFTNTDTIQFESNSTNVVTSAVFRDPSAWYHISFTIDTTQATSSNRTKIYVNGVLQTLTGSYVTQNVDTDVNNTTQHNIGASVAPNEFLNGYMTEINFVDGQALTPSSFGETDSNTGVWKPKAYTGTYGTNGFFLKFADNSNTTAATLGKDSSGNGNNWTPNNFSVTAGAGNDSLVDSPTSYGTDTGVGGSVRGNYCTWSAIDKASDCTLANGNLDVTTTNAPADNQVRGTIGVSSGKWYWEMLVNTTSNATMLGIVDASVTANTGVFPGTTAITYGYYGNNGNKYNNNTSSAYGNTYGSGDVIGCALDLDNGKIWWSKNGTWQASGDPAAGTNAAYTGVSGTKQPAAADVGGSTAINVTANFGQRAFAYTAPSGFKALCTQNLPTPTIGATSTTQANDYFNAVLYTGNGSTNNITGVGFQPDFVWLKDRTTAFNNYLYDAVRGTTKALQSNSTNAEETRTGLTAFGSDGFTLGSQGGDNQSSDSFVAWNWKANGAGSSNTAGTITSTVSANTTSGFSIVTYTGNGTTGATVGHGLGAVPGFIITKKRGTTTGNWQCWHSTFSGTQYITLNATNGTTTLSSVYNATPTSNVIQYGNDSDVNTNTATYVAYCFAPVAGYSAFGSFVGNANADGPFVFTNFRPRYVMIKLSSNAGEGWVLNDTSRSPYNVCAAQLQANSSGAEVSGDANTYVDILSNGFKIRTTAGTHNTSGYTYIYAAFAENPFKYSLAR